MHKYQLESSDNDITAKLEKPLTMVETTEFFHFTENVKTTLESLTKDGFNHIFNG
jgi:hypothetical protein